MGALFLQATKQPTCCRAWGGTRGCTIWVLCCGALQGGGSSCTGQRQQKREIVIKTVLQPACSACERSGQALQRLSHAKSKRAPNSTSLALFTSPSGPEMVVRVCPHLGPGAFSRMGKGRGLGTEVGRCTRLLAPAVPAAAAASVSICCMGVRFVSLARAGRCLSAATLYVEWWSCAWCSSLEACVLGEI